VLPHGTWLAATRERLLSNLWPVVAQIYGTSSSTVIPSMPALPLFRRARLRARARLLRYVVRRHVFLSEVKRDLPR
jgi:hypothetical protein